MSKKGCLQAHAPDYLPLSFQRLLAHNHTFDLGVPC